MFDFQSPYDFLIFNFYSTELLKKYNQHVWQLSYSSMYNRKRKTKMIPAIAYRKFKITFSHSNLSNVKSVRWKNIFFHHILLKNIKTLHFHSSEAWHRQFNLDFSSSNENATNKNQTTIQMWFSYCEFLIKVLMK